LSGGTVFYQPRNSFTFYQIKPGAGLGKSPFFSCQGASHQMSYYFDD
jgi:hypothetical protein